MKRPKRLRLALAPLAALVTTLLAVLPALGQTARLVYQGRLNDAGAGVNGSYEMEFQLFDVPDPGAGAAVGAPFSLPAVEVVDGAFSAPIEVDSSLLDGSPRYLEIRVRPAGSADAPIILSPRQTITAVPYAVHSTSAAQLNGVPADRFVRAQPSGAVGIGTDTPRTLLHLYWEPDSLTHLIETGGDTNAWAKVGFRNLNGQWDIGTSRGFNNDVFYIDRLGTTSLEFQLSTQGSLGLGIEPRAKLHLFETNSLTHLIETSGGTNAWAKVGFRNANGQWDIGTSRAFNGDQFYVSRPGAPTIAFAVQPNGDTHAAGDIHGTRLVLRGDPVAPMNAAVLTPDAGVTNFIPYNTTLRRAMNLIAHDATVRTLTILGGADLAEPFPVQDTSIEKGSVMVIDDRNAGHLRQSTQAYDRRVAGIISGAHGIQPGIRLRQEGVLDQGPHVALTGRVYVRANTSSGPIQPGDLLTTSDAAGEAMKVADHTRAQGAILGKAMGRLDQGSGLVLVLVTLQ